MLLAWRGQSDVDGGPARGGLCAVSQGAEKGERGVADGAGGAREGEDGDPGGRHGGHVRDAVLGGGAPGGGGGEQVVRDRDARDPERAGAGERGGERAGQADRDEHAAAAGERGAVLEAGGYRYRTRARGGDPAQPLWGERIKTVQRGALLVGRLLGLST